MKNAGDGWRELFWQERAGTCLQNKPCKCGIYILLSMDVLHEIASGVKALLSLDK